AAAEALFDHGFSILEGTDEPDTPKSKIRNPKFKDGVWFVNLAPITDPALVVSTIAQTLGVKETGGTPLLDSLKSYLREKQLLLLLDNFEQLLGLRPNSVGGAPAIADLLAAAPHIKVLVTSRERL